MLVMLIKGKWRCDGGEERGVLYRYSCIMVFFIQRILFLYNPYFLLQEAIYNFHYDFMNQKLQMPNQCVSEQNDHVLSFFVKFIASYKIPSLMFVAWQTSSPRQLKPTFLLRVTTKPKVLQPAVSPALTGTSPYHSPRTLSPLCNFHLPFLSSHTLHPSYLDCIILSFSLHPLCPQASFSFFIFLILLPSLHQFSLSLSLLLFFPFHAARFSLPFVLFPLIPLAIFTYSHFLSTLSLPLSPVCIYCTCMSSLCLPLYPCLSMYYMHTIMTTRLSSETEQRLNYKEFHFS